MAAVIENHQGLLLSLLNTTYNKKLLSSKEGRKFIDCKGRRSIAVIQMKSLAHLSRHREYHLQPFPNELLMGGGDYLMKDWQGTTLSKTSVVDTQRSRCWWINIVAVEYNEAWRWFGHAVCVDWFEWHGLFWVKKNKTIRAFKEDISCQGIYKYDLLLWWFFYWATTQANKRFKVRIELTVKVSSTLIFWDEIQLDSPLGSEISMGLHTESLACL